MSRLSRVAGALVLALAWPAGAGAAQDDDPRAALPERPSVATHAHTVAPGIVEVEFGYERTRAGGRFADAAVPATLKLGLAPRLQLAASSALDRPLGGGTSINTVDLALKWRFADGVPLAGALAVVPSVTLPTGTEASSGSRAAGILLIASRSLGPVSIDLNAGRTWRIDDGAAIPGGETLWAVSSGGPVRGRMGWMAELHGFPAAPGPAGHGTIVNAMLGGTVAMTPPLAFDAAVLLPISDEDDAAVFAGMVWNVGRLWSPRAHAVRASAPWRSTPSRRALMTPSRIR